MSKGSPYLPYFTFTTRKVSFELSTCLWKGREMRKDDRTRFIFCISVAQTVQVTPMSRAVHMYPFSPILPVVVLHAPPDRGALSTRRSSRAPLRYQYPGTPHHTTPHQRFKYTLLVLSSQTQLSTGCRGSFSRAQHWIELWFGFQSERDGFGPRGLTDDSTDSWSLLRPPFNAPDHVHVAPELCFRLRYGVQRTQKPKRMMETGASTPFLLSLGPASVCLLCVLPLIPVPLNAPSIICSHSKRLNGSCPDLRLPELFGSMWSQSGNKDTYGDTRLRKEGRGTVPDAPTVALCPQVLDDRDADPSFWFAIIGSLPIGSALFDLPAEGRRVVPVHHRKWCTPYAVILIIPRHRILAKDCQDAYLSVTSAVKNKHLAEKILATSTTRLQPLPSSSRANPNMVLARQFLGIQKLTNPMPTLRAIFSVYPALPGRDKGDGSHARSTGRHPQFHSEPRGPGWSKLLAQGQDGTGRSRRETAARGTWSLGLLSWQCSCDLRELYSNNIAETDSNNGDTQSMQAASGNLRAYSACDLAGLNMVLHSKPDRLLETCDETDGSGNGNGSGNGISAA
ncbi:uncharacterized protein CLUP02_14715 [Colletotrichum lupini]|uniref:Uncharacterized protein n=1 Tax=Colletotrichum lupini TaxID=145971 RepID=A0A9Q8T4W3_9PEZI|nr:uncharacterized protein CLUP02_14715 [Colletotrichum lupini]UQC89187.1 hypothetical protein CLUP02_14715 [Colletotrichum lupini]